MCQKALWNVFNTTKVARFVLQMTKKSQNVLHDTKLQQKVSNFTKHLIKYHKQQINRLRNRSISGSETAFLARGWPQAGLSMEMTIHY
jgi:hypothetical protein